ncbi:hypothetical protein [Pseudobacteriovorax antillogorgiicola]|uniref:DoxX protein n=1 Tax=Pseudobacteriovorax antillogorgiicola TaxID=1513793 RepID=A0A1Y6CQL5_9BACT|nr:hypothetical protein [Pseudobacteriovorax antillogorgiicola]TCS42227.1 hypothetical protein EDD56_14324 [Pseudobacteriovorax antillogorgiicola]SMF82748.1 hypothetical protein SAMN06296036_1433 [Pseudobacteriovorax antillogorgiicola]
MLEKKLGVALAALRATVFLVFFVWTIDKFVNPAHAAKVFETFYKLPGLTEALFIGIGGLQLALIVGFLIGWQKKFTYGAVLVMHSISTLSSYAKYLAPYEGVNLLFFAAWPMLAACLALYLLRDYDTLFTIDQRKSLAFQEA